MEKDMTQLDHSMDRLTRLAEELNQQAEEANDKIKEVEDRLNASNLGLEVRLHGLGLGYARSMSGQQWKIVGRLSPDDPYRPLAETSRETRIKLAPHLEELVEALLARAEEAHAMIQRQATRRD